MPLRCDFLPQRTPPPSPTRTVSYNFVHSTSYDPECMQEVQLLHILSFSIVNSLTFSPIIILFWLILRLHARNVKSHLTRRKSKSEILPLTYKLVSFKYSCHVVYVSPQGRI